jgi:hypothetical protein
LLNQLGLAEPERCCNHPQTDHMRVADLFVAGQRGAYVDRLEFDRRELCGVAGLSALAAGISGAVMVFGESIAASN